jgi:hypothetical protein
VASSDAWSNKAILVGGAKGFRWVDVVCCSTFEMADLPWWERFRSGVATEGDDSCTYSYSAAGGLDDSGQSHIRRDQRRHDTPWQPHWRYVYISRFSVVHVVKCDRHNVCDYCSEHEAGWTGRGYRRRTECGSYVCILFQRPPPMIEEA